MIMYAITSLLLLKNKESSPLSLYLGLGTLPYLRWNLSRAAMCFRLNMNKKL